MVYVRPICSLAGNNADFSNAMLSLSGNYP